MIDGQFNVRRPPALMRLLFLAVSVAIVYLSLYPLTGWRLRQPSMFSFFGHGLPRHYSQGDVVANLAAYLIFGTLLVLAWCAPWRPWRALLAATLGGFALSATLESLQSYLPTRVPSMLDVYANVAGATLGGLLGIAIARSRARRQADRQPVSLQWYQQGPALGWVLLIIWLLCQLPTQRLLFSTGPVVEPAWASAWLADLPTPSLQGMLETVAVATLIGVLGVLVMDLVRPVGARAGWILCLLALGLLLRMALAPARSEAPLLVWLTAGAQAGLLLGTALLYLIGALDRRQRLWFGAALVPLSLVLVLLASIDPYYQATVATARGPLEPALTPSLRSLIQLLGRSWPLLALAYCVVRLTTLRRPTPLPLTRPATRSL